MDSGSRGGPVGDRVYLDWNATAPLKDEARAAVLAAFELAGNPSSVHAEGRAARAVIEAAREAVAGFVGAAAADLVFTSGGTEANVMALTPHLEWPDGRGCSRLLVSAIEHPSVLTGGQFPGPQVEQIPATPRGIVDIAALGSRLDQLARAGERPLVSVMLANNETGVIQPIAAIADLVHRAGGLLHVDAVQAAGRINLNINDLGADLMTLSGHKIGAPKGVGALVRRSGDIQVTPLLRGGGQERRLRAGTENVAAIAGFGAAVATAIRAEDCAHMAELRAILEEGLAVASPDAVVFGGEAERLCNTTLFSAPGMSAETALIAFDLDGIALSSGSACSSGKVAPSHVLAAMGVGKELALGAIRVSLGPSTTTNDIERMLKSWRSAVARLNKTSKKRRGGLAA
jgi:cysteine desulfurase